jgi:hypothetical protein
MAGEKAPVGLADAHASVRRLHVAANVEQGTAGRCAKKVDEQLLLPSDAILSPVRPKTGELFVGLQAPDQIFRHGRDCVISAEARV